MSFQRLPTDAVFGFNPVDIDELDRYDNEANNLTLPNKRFKPSEKIISPRDLIWVRSLLNPSMESQFTKFKIVSVISYSHTTLICQLLPESMSSPNDRTIIGYFNIWWWHEALKDLEFSYLAELFKCFPFLERISQRQPLLKSYFADLILVKEPKLIQDLSDPTRTLLTCKRFLIIE